MNYCYNCGIDLTTLPSEKRTKEHIPAKTLFDGYSNDHKNNRITVRACYTCNQAYSRIDQELRNYIGIKTDGSQDPEILRKSIKSIMRNKDWTHRIEIENGKVTSVDFDYAEFRKLHIKNFKGLYAHLHGKPFPDSEFEIEIVQEGEPLERAEKSGHFFFNELTTKFEFSQSGSLEVFKFVFKSFNEVPPTGFIWDDNPNPNHSFVCAMVYNDNLVCIVAGTRKEVLEKMKRSRGIK